MDRFRVLLVDDNPAIREGICAMIDWEAYGYQLAGSADNGLSALEFLEKEPCDLIITDIRMPEMNGLELLRRAREIRRDVEAIVISAYSEFEYAQTAMQYGVENYLLKPISSEKLIESLLMVRSALEQKRKYRQHEFERILLRLLISPRKGAIRQEELRKEGIVLDACCYCLALMHLDAFDEKAEGLFGTDEEEETGQDIVMKFLTKYVRCYSTIISPDMMLVVFLLDEDRRNALKVLLSELAEHLELYSGAQIQAIIGERVSDIGSLAETYARIQAVMSNETFWDRGGVQIIDIAMKDEGENVRAFDIAPLLNAVRAMNPAAASHEAQLLSDRFRTEQPSIDLVRVTLSEIMFRLTDIVSEFGGDPDEALHSSGYHDRLYFSFHNIYELTRYLDETVQRLCEYLNRLVKKDGQIRVSDIVSYINNNYVEAITVKKLSEMFYISPVYLGRLFSAKMGTSLNSYVNSVRIRNAQTLLQTTDLKVYAICNNVGYKSIKYFYKVFKDEVGMTPHEYRLIHGMR